MIVRYRITPTGQIEFDDQRSFTYDGTFHQSKENKMRLKLSQDKQTVMLCLQEGARKMKNHSDDVTEESEFNSECESEHKMTNDF